MEILQVVSGLFKERFEGLRSELGELFLAYNSRKWIQCGHS